MLSNTKHDKMERVKICVKCGKWVISRLIMHHMGYSLAYAQKGYKKSSKMQENKPQDILFRDWVN